VVWNLIGLLDFAGAVVIAVVVRGSGPSYMVSLDAPVVGALRPTIYAITTWGVPLAIIVHILSLWQLANGAVV